MKLLYEGCELLDFNFGNAIKIIDTVSVAVFGTVIYDFCGRDADVREGRLLSEVISSELALIYPAEISEEIACAIDVANDNLKKMLLLDADAIYMRDPAANSVDEVICAYPGFFAVFCHRLANILYKNGAVIAARFISEYAHSMTGADIHPGASIGERFSIDHATGIVIGETAVIGSDVALYHGVTLGAKSLPKMVENRSDVKKRHPTIEDGCVIYACAGIYGGDTVVGKDSVIGAGVRVTASVPPNSRVYK